jgi:hypothetical protein
MIPLRNAPCRFGFDLAKSQHKCGFLFLPLECWVSPMLMFCVPLLARLIADRYKDLLESLSYSSLCAYIALSLSGLDSLAALVRLAPWTASLSTLSNDLASIPPENLNRAMRRLRWCVLKRVMKNPDEWAFFFDTTANPKRVLGLPGRGMWATSKGNVYDGRNLVVLVVVNKRTGVAIPVAWAPCIKQKDDQVNGKMAWELVLDLLDLVTADGFSKLEVGGDSWFDGLPFMEELNRRGFTFNVELKSSRTAKSNVAPNARWKLLAEQFEGETKEGVRAGTRESPDIPRGMQGMKYVAGKILWIRASKAGKDGKKLEMRVRVAAVYNHPAEKNPFAFYATNDITKSGVWQSQMARWRWNIEVLFRDLKQNLGWGKLACQSHVGCDAFIVIPFLIVAYIRLDVDPDGKRTIGEMLGESKQASLLHSLDFILANPNHGLLKKFKARMAPERACRKPVDSVAEKNSARALRKAA